MTVSAETLSTTLPVVNRKDLAKAFTDPRMRTSMEALLQSVVATPPVVNSASGNAASAVNTLGAGAFLLLAPDTAVPEASVLEGATGVSLDVSTAGIAKIVVDALAILNALTTIGFTKPVNAAGGLECSTLRIDQTPTASTTTSDHSVPVNINGVTMFLRLSATP